MTTTTVITGTVLHDPTDNQKFTELTRKYHAAQAQFDHGFGDSFAAFVAAEQSWRELQEFLREHFKDIFFTVKEETNADRT